MKSKQIIFTELRKAELLDVEIEALRDDEVLVKTEFSAISAGTERANFVGARNSWLIEEDVPAEFPRYPGYSSSGIVMEVGKNVKDLKIGDRVAVVAGYHRSVTKVNEKNVVKLPDNVSLKDASYGYISTFPMAAVRKVKVEIGESAMVMGLGILGLFSVRFLKASGAVPVIAVDPIASKRELALELGADYAFDPTEADFYDKVKVVTNGGVNAVIEVTGLGSGMTQALECMKKFGRIALLGCTRKSDFTVDYYRLIHGPGISVIGAHTMARPDLESSSGLWTYPDDLKAFINLLSYNRISCDVFNGHLYSPEDANEVYTRVADDKTFPVGAIFDWRNIK